MKSIYDRLNYYGGAWNSGGGGSGSVDFSAITGNATDNASLLLELQKRGSLPTTEISNSSNTPLTPTVGTPVYARRVINSDLRVTGYEIDVAGYTSSGTLELGMYTGAATGNLTQVANSVVQINVTATGFYVATLATPIILTAAQRSYYAGGLAVSGTYTLRGSQSAANASRYFSTGAALAGALPATESTRSATNVAFYLDFITA